MLHSTEETVGTMPSKYLIAIMSSASSKFKNMLKLMENLEGLFEMH